MGITYTIDHDQRLVFARGEATMTSEDIFRYQNEVWSRPEVRGYNEIIDMNGVTQIVQPSPEGMRSLAQLSASMDAGTAGAKFAIVAPKDLAFGLGRMYETFRAMTPQSTKQVQVFRSLTEALLWLANTEESDLEAVKKPMETG